MRAKFKDLLHQYKREVFKLQHGQKDVGAIARDCMEVAEEVLSQKYKYHFHKLPDANRAEIINMINNFTREAVLPPVVEKITARQVMLEHRIRAIERLIEAMLEGFDRDSETSESTPSA